MANAGPGLIDTRVLGKPLIFSGKEEHYPEWHESFLSWAGLFNSVIAGHLELAKTHPREINFEELPPEMQVMTQMVFHMFMQICCTRARSRSSEVFPAETALKPSAGFTTGFTSIPMARTSQTCST